MRTDFLRTGQIRRGLRSTRWIGLGKRRSVDRLHAERRSPLTTTRERGFRSYGTLINQESPRLSFEKRGLLMDLKVQ